MLVWKHLMELRLNHYTRGKIPKSVLAFDRCLYQRKDEAWQRAWLLFFFFSLGACVQRLKGLFICSAMILYHGFKVSKWVGNCYHIAANTCSKSSRFKILYFVQHFMKSEGWPPKNNFSPTCKNWDWLSRPYYGRYQRLQMVSLRPITIQKL